MAWIVVYSRKAAKLREKLPERVKAVLDALIIDIRATGHIVEFTYVGTHEKAPY